jgi:hypothetical protein
LALFPPNLGALGELSRFSTAAVSIPSRTNSKNGYLTGGKPVFEKGKTLSKSRKIVIKV